MDFETLRQKHKTFTFESFEGSFVDGKLKVVFHFKTDPDIEFKPEIIFPNITQERLSKIGPDVLNNLILNLGMVELMSYWKATCSPEIVIKAGFLNQTQLEWWKDLIINGLGQYFYENRIDFNREDLVHLGVEYFDLSTPLYLDELKDRDLILLSGGKDSAVSLETVKSMNKEIGALLLNPNQSSLDIVQIGKISEQFHIERKIDKKLLDLNSQGYLNGHTPFTAYLSFLSIFCQILYDFRTGIVSDEESSNEGNIEYLGKLINHQYSKSFDFEQKFNDYKNSYLSTQTRYFSVLRPLKDIQIAKVFAHLPQYHHFFRSCNVGHITNSWCGNCPKCLYTYLALFPHLGLQTSELFGKDLLQDSSLISLTRGLIGNGDLKPFECVGTFEENKILVYLSMKKYESLNQPLPPVLEALTGDVSEVTDEKASELFHFWNDQNNLPLEYKEALKKLYENS